MRPLKIIFVVLIALAFTFFGAKTIRTLTVVDTLTSLKTDHFTISYAGVYREDAEDVAKQLEDHYDRIRTELHDPDHDTIRVFIHSTQQDFNNATGLMNSRANGESRGPLEFHILWTTWYNSIFPDIPQKTAIHEFTHCVQLNILIQQALRDAPHQDSLAFNTDFEKKFAENYPQWLWEALCTYEANEHNAISIAYAMRQKPTLKALNNSNRIYLVGYTLVEYIVDHWGKDKLPALITTYGDIQKVLELSEGEFEKGWLEFVEERY